jgi:hypothetical protein
LVVNGLTHSARYLTTAIIIHPSLSSFLLPKQPIGKIHIKMPVILLLEDGDEWLNPDIRAGAIIAFVKTVLRPKIWTQNSWFLVNNLALLG